MSASHQRPQVGVPTPHPALVQALRRLLRPLVRLLLSQQVTYPYLATLLKNLNDTAHNLLDASEDLRTHPWKLLNKPETDEIAFANLRNASQSYVRAMREVNEASARLFQLMQRKDLDDPRIQDLVRRALEAFDVSLGGYRRAEERWQKLFREAKAGRK